LACHSQGVRKPADIRTASEGIFAMLLPIAALLLTYALTALIAIFAAVALWRPLSILLAELCGTEDRSRFWTVWSMVMMIATPTLLVSMRYVAIDPTELVQGTVTSALFGVLLALVGMGFAVWSRSPRAEA
jgi:hypothetical protein